MNGQGFHILYEGSSTQGAELGYRFSLMQKESGVYTNKGSIDVYDWDKVNTSAGNVVTKRYPNHATFGTGNNPLRNVDKYTYKNSGSSTLGFETTTGSNMVNYIYYWDSSHGMALPVSTSAMEGWVGVKANLDQVLVKINQAHGTGVTNANSLGNTYVVTAEPIYAVKVTVGSAKYACLTTTELAIIGSKILIINASLY